MATSFGPMGKFVSNMFSFSRGGHKDISITNALVYMIVKDDFPLRLTEKTGFRTFMKAAQPLYQIPSEPNITKKIELKYDELREKFGDILTNAESICLTTDIWTHSSTMKSYLGVTAHYKQGEKNFTF